MHAGLTRRVCLLPSCWSLDGWLRCVPVHMHVRGHACPPALSCPVGLWTVRWVFGWSSGQWYELVTGYIALLGAHSLCRHSLHQVLHMSERVPATLLIVNKHICHTKRRFPIVCMTHMTNYSSQQSHNSTRAVSPTASDSAAAPLAPPPADRPSPTTPSASPGAASLLPTCPAAAAACWSCHCCMKLEASCCVMFKYSRGPPSL